MSKAAALLMQIAEPQPPAAPPSVMGALLPIMGVVLVGFLVIGLALPVLPLHVSRDLGFGAFVTGLVTGGQFVASLVSRIWAGHFADRKGAKSGVVAGLFAAAASGLLYVLSLALTSPAASVGVLLLGRAVLGGAESFIITGAVSWGLVLVGPQGAGRVIAWVGTAMFAALALARLLGRCCMAPVASARSPSQRRSSRSQRCCCLCGCPQCVHHPQRPGVHSGAWPKRCGCRASARR